MPHLWKADHARRDHDEEDQRDVSHLPRSAVAEGAEGEGMKPKANHTADPQGMDVCNTPAYALDPLLPYIQPEWAVWEPAASTGNLYNALAPHVLGIMGSELRTEGIGEGVHGGCDFFTYQPRHFDAIVTNPPYSIKFDWLERCYELAKPFALLVPVETIGAQAAQKLMERYGSQLLLLNRRVNFQMPNKGWSGSGAQFPVLWLCWKMLPAPIIYGKLTPRAADQAVMELAS